MKVTDIKHLVLSGGGLLGVSYIGLIKYLEENLPQPIIKTLKSITGCSAGAIFGSLLAIGYTSTELDIIVKDMKFKDYININAESLINFMKLKGLESGKILINFIKKCIKDKVNNENITFKEIKDKFNIELQIGVTNLTKSRFEIMNSRNTPDVPIHKAISASVAIPFVFEPIVIGDEIFCDGGLLNNLPIETLLTDTSLFEDENKIEIINIQKENKDENKDEEKEDNNTTEKDEEKKDNNTKEKDEEKKDNNTKEKDTDRDKEDNSNSYSSILGVYLLAKNNIVNRDNYQNISLSNYMNMMIHTLSSEYINNKIQYSNLNNLNNKNKKYKIIVFNIPCDIMSFLKLNSSHDDINNIIDIAYKTSLAAF